MSSRKSVLLIYHFFHPDTVISARLFSDLAQDLTEAGYEVTVYTGNRLIWSQEKLPDFTEWNGVHIKRFSCPEFPHGSMFKRLFNALILQLRWLLAFRKDRNAFDTIILGTDPQFCYFMFPFLRIMNRKVRLIHWAFDVFPEAILVHSPRWMKILAGLTCPFLPWAYRPVDVMADIGPCMRERLQKYHHHAECVTLTPWALKEPEAIPPADPEIRQKLFGSAKLALLYSGTVGYGHNLAPFIQLARECRNRGLDVAFCFAGYGNCYKEQIAELTAEDTNISVAGFVPEEELEKRLSSADIHMISLRPGGEGFTVPSKFFGALAMGRPILFSGPDASEIAQWCNQYGLGKTLDEETLAWFQSLLDSPDRLQALKVNTFHCYHQHFSRRKVVTGWLTLLKNGRPEGQE